jgi:uncharacterized membrane protein
MYRVMILAPALLLAACQSAGEGERTTEPYAAIGADETIRFTGTEPFWGGEVTGERLLYSTIENPDGTAIAVGRFAGNSGLGFSGTLAGARFDMTVTEGECSDGMSDRTYPLTVTLMVGEEQRNGCAWTEARPFSGPGNP